MSSFFCCLLVSLFHILNIPAQVDAKADSIAKAQFIKQKLAKADSLNTIALTITANSSEPEQLNNALSYVMQGLHIYSSFNNSNGLMRCFDNLGVIYRKEKKYTQAKWFILQANNVARLQKDTVSIIHSLIALAAVKTDINDIKLAKRDVNEIYQLVNNNKSVARKLTLLQDIGAFYRTRGDSLLALVADKRIITLKDSVERAHNRRPKPTNNATLITSNSAAACTLKAAMAKTPKKNIHLLLWVIVAATTALLIGLLVWAVKTPKKLR